MACDGTGLEPNNTEDGPEPWACPGCKNCTPQKDEQKDRR